MLVGLAAPVARQRHRHLVLAKRCLQINKDPGGAFILLCLDWWTTR
jgi:hypothetical protein